MAKTHGIDDYYRKNNIKYRSFNLTGLYSKKFGIKSDKQRYVIRELCRCCDKFLHSDYINSKIEKQMKNPIKDDEDNEYSTECCYIFESGENKNQKCRKERVNNTQYCKECEIVINSLYAYPIKKKT
jgi:hypothetical protein